MNDDLYNNASADANNGGSTVRDRNAEIAQSKTLAGLSGFVPGAQTAQIPQYGNPVDAKAWCQFLVERNCERVGSELILPCVLWVKPNHQPAPGCNDPISYIVLEGSAREYHTANRIPYYPAEFIVCSSMGRLIE